MPTSTYREYFEYTTKSGDLIEVSFDREVSWSVDKNYGADADGNRGIEMSFLDDDDFDAKSITLSDDNYDERPATPEELPEIQQAILAYMQTHDPNENELYIDEEPDMDDIDD